MGSYPPLRHGNQQGSLSARTRRLLRLYREDLEVRYSGLSLVGYPCQLGFFLRWLDERRIEVLEVRPADLVAYQSELLTLRTREGKPYAVSSQVNRLKVVKSFFRFLLRRGYLLTDPSISLALPREEKRLPRTILTPEEARRILEAPGGRSPRELRDRATLETLYGTGIRVGELLSLTPYDVDTEERRLHVVLGKGRKGRMVPLTTAAARAIEAYLALGRPSLLRGQKTPFLFVSNRGGPWYPPQVNVMIHSYAARARIKKNVSSHTFRHSVATHLLKGRADIRHIQALLGHASLQSTERYTRVEISDLQAVIARAHPRGR